MFKPRNLKVSLLVIGLLFVGITNSNAQRWKLLRYQVGGGVGVMQIFGDIGGTASEENWYGIKDLKIDETHLAYYFNVGYKINTRFSTKFNINYGKGSATDLDSRNDRGRSWTARLLEPSAQLEYYFLAEEARRSAAMYNRNGMVNNFSTISLYTYMGLGAAISWLDHEEGVVIPADSYKSNNVAPVVFLGLGAKYVIDARWYLNAEFGYRWALNDYVEGYSQTLSSQHNDVYYILMFSANYRLKTSRRNIPGIIDRKYKKYGY